MQQLSALRAFARATPCGGNTLLSALSLAVSSYHLGLSSDVPPQRGLPDHPG